MSVLDRLEALLAQATPERPWTRGTYDAESTSDVWAPGDPKTGAVSICDFATNADAALICGAVNALPALIACARAAADLRARIEPEDDAAWGDIAALERLDAALARLAEGGGA